MTGADANTLKDAFDNEQWWAPYREHGCSSALFVGPAKIGSTATLLSDDELANVAAAAEQTAESTAFVAHHGLFMLAAARLPFLAEAARLPSCSRARSPRRARCAPRGAGAAVRRAERLGAHGDASRLEPFIGREDKGVLALDGAVAAAKSRAGVCLGDRPGAGRGAACRVAARGVGRRGHSLARRAGRRVHRGPQGEVLGAAHRHAAAADPPDARATLPVPEPAMDRTTPSQRRAAATPRSPRSAKAAWRRCRSR